MIIVVFIAIAIILACVGLLIGEIGRYLARTRNNQETRALNQTFASAKVNWWSITWMTCLTLLCLGIVGYGYYPQMTWCNVGYHLGRKTGQAIILWLVFSVTLGRKQGFKKGFLSFLLIAAAGCTGGLISYTQAQSEQEQLKTELRQLFMGAPHAQTPSTQTQRETSSAPALRGESAELRGFFTTVVNKMVALQNDYQRELNASGIASILDPARLQHDGTLAESKRIIGSAKAVITKYRKQMDILRASLEEEIKKLRLSAESKSEVLRGFRDSQKKRRAEDEAMWKCEEGVVSQFENIVALLSRRRGGWIIQNGELHFLNESDLGEFNSYLTMIDHLIGKQEELQKQAVGAAKALLN